MTDEGQPSCDLLEAQFLVRLGRFDLSAEVTRTMSRDDLDRALLHRCFESLSSADFGGAGVFILSFKKDTSR